MQNGDFGSLKEHLSRNPGVQAMNMLRARGASTQIAPLDLNLSNNAKEKASGGFATALDEI